MLSRTADHIFWMARYLERADNAARLLNVCYETAPMSNNEEAVSGSWRTVLETLEILEDYQQVYDSYNSTLVLNYVIADITNLSSVISCLTSARENVRAIRGTVSTEVWESINGTWLDLKRMLKNNILSKDPSRLFAWLGSRIDLIYGVMQGTMLRNEANSFMRLGTFLERADNTARLLNVRFFHEEKATRETQASKNINLLYHWSAVLRSISSLEIYRQVVRDAIEAQKVIELIVFERNMPHSLAYATEGLYAKLRSIANKRSDETVRIAGKLDAMLRFGTIEELNQKGIKAFLEEYLEQIHLIGQGINNDFLWPVNEV